MAPTVAILLGGSIRKLVEKGLESFKQVFHHDAIITSEGNYRIVMDSEITNWAKLHYFARAVWYRDPWGCDHADRGVAWEDGPRAIGDPLFKFNGKSYGYLFNDSHVDRYSFWRKVDLLNPFCAGVFDDDFGYDRRHWTCDQGDEGKDYLWPEWRMGNDWNESRMQAIELAVGSSARMGGKLHIINGSRRISDHTRVFWEGFGPLGDPDSWNQPPLIEQKAREGDIACLRILEPDGTVAEKYKEHVPHLIGLALRKGMMICLSFAKHNRERGSQHSYWESFESWPEEVKRWMD